MEEKTSRKYWYIFSIADLVFIIFLVGILTYGSRLISDMITGVHIRVGEYIIDNLAIPTHDIFSHSMNPMAWTPPQWLAEVLIGALYKMAGLTGLTIFMAFFIAAVYAILFKFMRSSGVSIIVAILITLLAAGASAIHWLARPHIFSIMFTLLWYIILESYQHKKKIYLYWLPILMALWVNIHGGFVVGFLLLLIYILGNILKARYDDQDKIDSRHRARILILFLLICLLSSLLNPQSYKMLLSPFQVIANQTAVNNIQEWQSPDFHGFQIYEYLLLIMILALGISVKRLNIFEVLLILLFTHLSLYSGRFIPLFALIVSPIIGKQVDNFMGQYRGKSLIDGFCTTSENMAAADAQTKWHLWSYAAMALVIILFYSGQIAYQFDKSRMPVDAVQFLKTEHISGNIFNSDSFGSYLLYAAYPEYEVFYDQRECYGQEKRIDIQKVMMLKRGWEDVFDKYDISWIIYQNNSALSNVLVVSDDWHLIYSDSVANIFVKKIPQNQELIDKYPNIKPVSVESIKSSS